MKAALKKLLDRLDAIADEHGEVTDTHVRELMYESVYHGFIVQTPGFTLPGTFGMIDPEGDVAVRAALAEFLPAARAAGFGTPLERFAAFQDGSVLSDAGNPYDDYFGHADTLEQLASANEAKGKVVARAPIAPARRKRSPFNQRIPNRGAVVAVQLESNLWCYVREYVLCHGFLPFSSTSPLRAEQLPTLKAAVFFDLWCYDSEETPMVLVGTFPFQTEEESIGEPYYTGPGPHVSGSCYKIHEVRNGVYAMRKTLDRAEVAGIRLQRRYQPHEFQEFVADKRAAWPIITS